MGSRFNGSIELQDEAPKTQPTSSRPAGASKRVSTAFWVLDDSFFDAPQLRCARLPEQGTFALSMQPVLTLEGLDPKLFNYLKERNETLHFTSTLSMSAFCTLMVVNALAIMYVLEAAGCDSLMIYILPRECYFLLLYASCFVLIRAAVLKTYVLQPMVGLFKMYEPTATEILSLVVFGASLVVFSIHVAVLHAAVSLSSYSAAISLTLTGLLTTFVGMAAFGMHVRSFTRRPNHPGLTVPPPAAYFEWNLLVNATSLAHIVEYTQLDQERVDIMQGLSILTESNQSAMLSVSCLTMMCNIFGMCYSLEHMPDSCREDSSVEYNVSAIVRVEALLMPVMCLCYAVLRVYLIKSQVARPIAECFNLKKSSDYTGMAMGLLGLLIVGGFVLIVWLLRYDDVANATYWASSVSCFSCLCAGAIILMYSYHCNGLIQKVMATFIHSISSKSRAAV